MKAKFFNPIFAMLLLGTTSLLMWSACQPAATVAPSTGAALTDEQVKAMMDKTLDLWNNHNLAVVEELYAPDFHRTTPRSSMKGYDEFKAYHADIKKIYPDLKLTITSSWAQGDQVISKWNYTATNTGAFSENLPATGKPVSVDGVSILTLKDGKVVEDWSVWDQWGAFMAMGYKLQPPSTAAAPAEKAAESK